MKSMIKGANPHIKLTRLVAIIRPRGFFIPAKEGTTKLSLNGISNRIPIEPLSSRRHPAVRKP